MSLRVAYWTSAFDPDIEAVAKEVAYLRAAFPGSIIWGIGPPNSRVFSCQTGLCFHPRIYWLFRAIVGLAQGLFHVNHIFGGVDDWFHLRALRARPSVLSVALPCVSHQNASLLRKIDQFVVEWPGGVAELERLGIPPGRIRVIFPPVDLDRFRPSPSPDGPFTVLFASSPQPGNWLEGRGLRILLDAAYLRPHMRFRLVWRPWGDSLPIIQQWIKDSGVKNVELVVGRFLDMENLYKHAHVTTAPFTAPSQVKPVPNSVLESLGCGRPVIVTSCVGVAQLVEDWGAGLVCEPSGYALAECLDWLQQHWAQYSYRATQLANEHFSLRRFLASYRSVYEELCK